VTTTAMQVWAIDPMAPSMYDVARRVGGPVTAAQAKQKVCKHNARTPWNGYPTHYIALPLDETPPEYVERPATRNVFEGTDLRRQDS
jgi:hypothetical protein